MYTIIIIKCLYWRKQFENIFMEEGKQVFELEITIKEMTSWGLISKTFSNREIKVNRAVVIAEVIQYLSKYLPEDYRQAIRILTKKRE